MQISDMSADQLGMMIDRLDYGHEACHIRVGEVRRQVDIACGQGHISLREWRSLLDRITAFEAQFEDLIASDAVKR